MPDLGQVATRWNFNRPAAGNACQDVWGSEPSFHLWKQDDLRRRSQVRSSFIPSCDAVKPSD